MADKKAPKTVIKKVPGFTPGQYQTADESATLKERVEAGCAIVEIVLHPQLDQSDPMNPKQIGKKSDIYIASMRQWNDWLRTHVTLGCIVVKVKQFPKEWEGRVPTYSEWTKGQVELKKDHDKAEAKKLSEKV